MNEADCFSSAAVIIPSLDPDEKLYKVVHELVTSGFHHIIIIDDGSKAENQHYFTELQGNKQCTVIHHGENKGKGRALKTAFSYAKQCFPEIKGVITVDGDGQHLTKDIIACGEAMLQEKDALVLGCRCFEGDNVPSKNAFGNKLTSGLFRRLFKIDLSDTQTGLRAIPMEYLGEFTKIKGERFEYETNMLLQAKRLGIRLYQQPIETVYDEKSYSTHYNAVKDSWRIFKIMVRYKFSRK